MMSSRVAPQELITLLSQHQWTGAFLYAPGVMKPKGETTMSKTVPYKIYLSEEEIPENY